MPRLPQFSVHVATPIPLLAPCPRTSTPCVVHLCARLASLTRNLRHFYRSFDEFHRLSASASRRVVGSSRHKPPLALNSLNDGNDVDTSSGGAGARHLPTYTTDVIRHTRERVAPSPGLGVRGQIPGRDGSQTGMNGSPAA